MAQTLDEFLADMANWGNRDDGSKKDIGFLGPIPHPSGGFSTELSYSVGVDGKDITFPLIVETLTKEQIQALMASQEAGAKPPKDVVDTALEHAFMRMQEGKSPFYNSGE